MSRFARHVTHRGLRRTVVLALLAAVVALVVGSAGTHGPAAPRAASAAAAKPNIVFILTDDQRIDELGHMPNVQSLIQAKGIVRPVVRRQQPVLSEPSRRSSPASTATPPRSTTTTRRFGGFQTFHNDGYEKTHTLPVWLHKAGYRTAMMGKYLNGYNERHAACRPVGSIWDGLLIKDNGGYFNYKISANGTVQSFGSTAADYSTDVLGQRACRLHQHGAGEPAAVPVVRAARAARSGHAGAALRQRVRRLLAAAVAERRRDRPRRAGLGAGADVDEEPAEEVRRADAQSLPVADLG